MERTELASLCDLGVKEPCIACEFTFCCNGKWRHPANEEAEV